MQQTLPYSASTHEVRVLPNGMTVLLERLPHLRSASAGLWIKTGSANEPAHLSGISHLLEHLFFKGTTTRSARQLMEAIESGGGHINAFTSRDYTALYVKTLDTHVADGIEILADILKNSQFNDFEKERNVVLEEIASVEDVPEEFVQDLLLERLWPDHALGRSIAGTQESVSALTLDDIRSYLAAWCRPDNLVFSIAGNIDTDVVLAQLENEFGFAAPGGNGAVRPQDTPAFGFGISAIERDIAQEHICIGFPAPSILDQRRYTCDMLSGVLGGGSTSRLFDRIRENEGLAYSIYSLHSCCLQSGFLGVYAAVAPENFNKVIDMTFEELRRLKDDPMTQAELELNREQLKGGLLMALESTYNRMSRMAKTTMHFGRVLTVDEVLESVEAVTAEDVQRMAHEAFTSNQCTMVVLGPANDSMPREVPL